MLFLSENLCMDAPVCSGHHAARFLHQHCPERAGRATAGG